MTAAAKAMARASRADVSSRLPGKAPAGGTPRGGVNQRLQALLPKLVLSPSVFLVLVFVYGFIAFTGYLSFTGSRILPSFELVGLDNYVRLFSLRNWSIALRNLAIFGVLYIAVCTAIGLFLAILLDQKIRGEGMLRPIYLYPMALSFIVTGTAWKWFLDPGIGLQNTMHLWGWESFEFTWIKDRTIRRHPGTAYPAGMRTSRPYHR